MAHELECSYNNAADDHSRQQTVTQYSRGVKHTARGPDQAHEQGFSSPRDDFVKYWKGAAVFQLKEKNVIPWMSQ